jgi:hypothetical protein
MGHQHLGPLPRTRSWQEVVALVEHGAPAPQVANAAIRAAERGLLRINRDAGAIETVWLLTQLPFAARSRDFEDALLRCGLRVPNEPALLDLVAAFSRAVDDRLAATGGRTDLGEMAQMAAAETLAGLLGERTDSLYAVTHDEVRRALAGLHTAKQFGLFAKQFFGRLLFKALDYYLSRVLPGQVGGGRRFDTLAQLRRFTDILETHCMQAAVIVQRYFGESTAARMWRGGITREGARDLAHGAVHKLIQELRVGAGLPAEPEEGGAVA